MKGCAIVISEDFVMIDLLRKSRYGKIAFLTALNLSLILVSVLYVFAFLLFGKGSFSCVFYSAVGVPCPGCGGTRSLFYLFSLDIRRSFLFYPPLYVMIGYVLFFEYRVFISALKNDTTLAGGLSPLSVLVIPASVILFFFVRIILIFCFDFNLIIFAQNL